MERAHVHDKHKGPRSRGEKVSGSRWEVWWTEPDRATGKTATRRRRFAKKVHADAFAAELNEKFREGVKAPSTDGKKLVSEVAAMWLTSRRDVKASHRDRSARELRAWVLPRFGHREVGAIERSEVQAFANDLLDGAAECLYATGLARARAPLAPTSVRSIVGQVRGVMTYAVDNNMLSAANPALRIKIDRIEKTKKNFLTIAQVEGLRNIVAALPQGKQHALAVQVMAYLGLRIGELLQLRPEDVDLGRRRIVVERSWTTDSGKWTVGPTKTSRTRSVPVGASLAAELATYMSEAHPTDYLFCGPRGIAAWQPDNWRTRVRKTAITGTEFEVMGLTPHDLRHTAASTAIASGATAPAVQALLGHASLRETLDTYTQLWPDDLDNLTRAVEAARNAALGLAP